MNVVFKILVFSILLNFSVGIMLAAIPAFKESPEYSGGLYFNESYASSFTGSLEGDVTPSGELEDAGNAIYRVLDMMNIGFIAKFLLAVKQYLYGFIVLLDITLGGLLEPPVRNILFKPPTGIFYVLITIGYIIGAFYLWTGKSLFGDAN